MIRNLKTFGLALVGVFALSAAVSAVASAQQGTLTSTGPVTLTGEETPKPPEPGKNALTYNGLRVECNESTYTGHKYNVTPHTLIPVGATTFTITPHYKQTGVGTENCKVNPGEFRATVDMNGCDYVAHIGGTTGGVVGTYTVTFDIVCPVGKEITLTVWTSGADDTNGVVPMCIQHIPAQAGLGGAHLTDTGNGHIDLTGPIKNIKVTQTKSTTHPILCPHKEAPVAELDIDVTLKGHNAAGEPTSISLSHP